MKTYGTEVEDMSEKKDFLARFGASLDLPRESLPGGFSLVLSGCDELLLRGRVRILSYREEEILLLIEKKRLRITGNKLFFASFEKENMRIIGTVMGLNFETGGKHAN